MKEEGGRGGGRLERTLRVVVGSGGREGGWRESAERGGGSEKRSFGVR